MRFYLDTSAAAKLLKREAETDALRALCARPDVNLVSTDLLETELRRVMTRESIPSTDVTEVLDRVTLHAMPRSLYLQAGLLPGGTLRSFDALHIAGAIQLQVDAILVYDERMRSEAVAIGVSVEAPSG